MLLWTVKWTVGSLTLIMLVHHLYLFLRNLLTVPKIKDLVNKPAENYRLIFNTSLGGAVNAVTPLSETAAQQELVHFLKELKRPSN